MEEMQNGNESPVLYPSMLSTRLERLKALSKVVWRQERSL